MIEVPDDAIQVDVWTHDTETGAFGKTKFFTKAEAPPCAAEGHPRNGGVDDLAPFAQHELAREVATADTPGTRPGRI